MYGLLAGLSVWMAGIASQPQGVGPADASGALVQNELPSVTTRIAGRPIKVQVQVYRDLTPLIDVNTPGTADNLVMWVRVSTPDGRGLPSINSIRATVVNSRFQAWTSNPRPIPTLLVYDRKSMMYSANGGPRWTVGSPVTVRIDIRTGTKTTTVSVPARIGALS